MTTLGLAAAPPAQAPPEQPQIKKRPSKTIRRRNRKEAGLFLLLILPNLAALVIFGYYPALYNFVLSMTDWDFVAPAPTWVGLDKYAELLADPSFYEVLANTAIFTGVSVFGTMVGGLAIGLLLSRKLRFTGFTRTMAFAPHMLPGATVGILWLFMFDPTYGLSRWFFSLFGAASPAWTTTSDWSLWAITIAYTWQRLGFVAVIYYTAILDLPQDILEAAQLDGAGAWTMGRRIILPLLGPVSFFLIVTGVIASAQTFDIIATLTGGGPGTSSSTLTWMIYEEGFQRFDVGRAAATATVLFVVLMIITLIQVKVIDRRVHYT
ncbi:carbohydrate ABC transporter permease [Pseudactinotalea sp. Z1748]|uniref:carbohydrate ABC transporter permease n=1 Tax=Pseudactinotalea sp. Z1748 TaxID=3413027 RepID=UPI003C7BC699